MSNKDIILIVEKTDRGLVDTRTIHLNPKDMKSNLKLSRELSKLMNQGFQLVDVEGEGPIADHLRKQIEKYRLQKDDYRGSLKETIKLGVKESPHKERPTWQKVKRFLKR